MLSRLPQCGFDFNDTNGRTFLEEVFSILCRVDTEQLVTYITHYTPK